MSSLILPNGKIDNIKMVIFDKDGTLIDVHHYWCSMIEFRAEFFIKSLQVENIDKNTLYDELVDGMGIDLKTKKMKSEGPVGIKPRDFILEVAFNIMKKYDNSYKKSDVIDIFLKVDEYSKLKLNDIVKPLNGVVKLLENLKQNNILMSIATTDLSTRAILAMEKLNLKKYFTDIAGADLVKNPKPNADLVEYILDKQNLNILDVVVVGDSMADLNMAKNAKCKFLAVKTGLYTEEFLLKSEKIIENLTQVRVVI